MNQTPQETLKQLQEIFPPFQAWWEKSEESPPPVRGLVDGVQYHWTHQAVISVLLGYMSAKYAEFTPLQLRKFGDWVDRALEQEGDLESALSTYFLDHLHQVNFRGAVSPYLSAKAKRHA